MEIVETRERFAIAAPAHEVWRLVGAFFALPEITPVYTASRMEGQGRFRRLTDREGGELLEALLSYDEETRRFAYRIVATKGVDLPYAEGSYVGTLRVVGEARGRSCALEVGARYEPKPGREAEAAAETRDFYADCVLGIARRLKLA